MNAYDTIQQLHRLARLPVIDDAQLETLVLELLSSDSYTVHEDVGYGATSSDSYEVTVSGAAESALREAGTKVLSRLVKRLRKSGPDMQQALLRVLGGTKADSWATLSSEERTEARNLIELAVGSAHVPLATLAIPDEKVTAPAARARDLISMRLSAIEDAERATETVVQAAMSPSREANWAAIDAAKFLGGSTTLGPRLIDAFLDPRVTDRYYVSEALSAAKVRLDATQRARLLAVADDRERGHAAHNLLAPYLKDPGAEAEFPLRERLMASIARYVADSANEGMWHWWIKICGHSELGFALVPVLRERLARGKASEVLLHNMTYLGVPLAPIAPELLRYLDPMDSPSPRHVLEAVRVAGSIESPVTVPALIPLLLTPHQYPVLRALAEIGPQAAKAIPAIEQLRFAPSGVSWEVVQKQQAETLAKLRGK